MSQTLEIPSFDPLNLKEATTLAADAAGGASSLTVASTQGFTSGLHVIIGTPGKEQSEIAAVGNVTAASTLPLASPTNYVHSRFSPVTVLFGDQIKIYSAPNINGTIPADSSFTAVSGGLLNIIPDQATTTFTDPNGNSGVWYKFTYIDSTSGNETSLSASNAVRASVSRYVSIEDVKSEAGLERADYIKDATVDSKIMAAQEEINSNLSGVYTVPFSEPINPFIADICKRLAAGLLLLNQFGAYDSTNKQLGQNKVDQARADLAKLQDGQTTLVDDNGGSLADPASGIGFNSSFTDNPDDTGFFSRSDVIGYTTRRY